MNKSSVASVACPLHPSENIQRVDLELGAEKEVYCIECLLNIDDAPSKSKQLKSLDQFIEQASQFYSENRKRIDENKETPSEYQNILDTQSENLEILSQHIEKEKQKVQSKFDELT